ncbi:MAG: glycoside hydrolase family 5 protein [Kiritimatiellia bacterium]
MSLKWLDVRDGKLVDETGAEVRLHGIGLGNWFVHEGYMFDGFHGPWDKPRNIRKLVALLAGKAYSEKFWKRFYETYITEADIAAIKEDGYNSVRLPLDYELLMEDEITEISFKEEGFRMIDHCVELCRKHDLYVILDLHCAPGGQTGSNIDNAYDSVPRLLLDATRQRQCIALWRKLAERYRDEPVVAMYDLLNEPIATKRPGQFYKGQLRQNLIDFHKRLVAAIREIDRRHILSIEGAHWATDVLSFPESFDPRMVVHFHMYGEFPGLWLFQRWQEVGRRLHAPLLLGETGENEPAWISAVLWDAEQQNCSTNLWCWKKVPKRASPTIIIPPEGWDRIRNWTRGDPAPEPEEAQKIFDAFLESIRFENCMRLDAVRNAVARKAPFAIRATDFDSGEGDFHAEHPQSNIWNYRLESGLKIETIGGVEWTHGPGFYTNWELFELVLTAGDEVCYTAKHVPAGGSAVVLAHGDAGSSMELAAGDVSSSVSPSTEEAKPVSIRVLSEGRVRLKIRCVSGTVRLQEIRFELPKA